METLSFNNVQSQENDYWQDLEILPENNVRLQANDDNEVVENVDDYRDGMDINADDQNIKSPARNSKTTDCNYSSGPEVSSRSTLLKIDAIYDALDDEHKKLFINSCFGKLYNVRSMQISPKLIHNLLIRRNSRLTPELRDIAKVLDDSQLRVRCILYASPDEREEEYVKLFVSGPTREDLILDAYLHEDRADGAARDEKLDDIFEHIREDDPHALQLHRMSMRQKGAEEADDREVDTGVNGMGRGSIKELVDAGV
ncbi:Uncharacterized protein Fot_06481 [Forsythia ovata]|uniref:Uncharacterized protein n=1 Tax=Forsythia ovata TaxID=205694 RepID=A0ABD1WT46_9LAMI